MNEEKNEKSFYSSQLPVESNRVEFNKGNLNIAKHLFTFHRTYQQNRSRMPIAYNE